VVGINVIKYLLNFFVRKVRLKRLISSYYKFIFRKLTIMVCI